MHSDNTVLPLLSAVAAARADASASECGNCSSDAATEETSFRPDVMVEGRLAPFLTKLFNLVSAADTDETIRWTSDGRSIVIVDSSRLSREVLPRFFKHNKLGTFTQQLYLSLIHISEPTRPY